MMSKREFKISAPAFNASLYLFLNTSSKTGHFSHLVRVKQFGLYPRKYQEVSDSDFSPIQFLMAFSHKENRCFYIRP